MTRKVRIFVSYSHLDEEYLEDDSLLGFLRDLETEGIEFWIDQRITTGDLWDDKIKARIAESDIALVLVSQWFLNSEYCTKVEIGSFLDEELVIFPVMLSACNWRRHEWLKTRQFLPGGDKTIEEDFTDPGARKRLFFKISEDLRQQVEKLRGQPMLQPASPSETQSQAQPSSGQSLIPNPFGEHQAIRNPDMFIGREAELRRLNTLLEGGSVAILGEPKIGKSSLLWQLKHVWKGEVLGPIDFRQLTDRASFYHTLAQELGLSDAGWREIRQALRDREAILLLDDLDMGPNIGFDTADLHRFRSLCSQNRGFKLVTVSHQPLKITFSSLRMSSRGYDFLQPFTLGEMTEQDLRSIRAHSSAPEAEDLDESAIRQELKLAGGQPIPNPFDGSSGLPAIGSSFIWPVDFIRRIRSRWDTGGLLPVVFLHGHRRMGKSSIIRNIGKLAPSEIFLVYLDMHDLGWVEQAGELLLTLADVLHRRLSELGLEVGPLPKAKAYKSYKHARRALDAFLDRFDSQLTANHQLVLAIDEYELLEDGIRDERIDPHLLLYLRTLNQRFLWFNVFLCGLHTLEEMGHEFQSAFYGQAEHIRVSYLSRDDAITLVTQPAPDFALDYSDALLNELYRLTYGQPYLLQRLCWEMVNHWNERFLEQGESTLRMLELEDLDRVLTADLFAAADYYFDGVWSNVTEGEQDLMTAMAQREEPWVVAELSQLADVGETLEETLGLLKQHDVVLSENGTVGFASELMRRWVQDRES